MGANISGVRISGSFDERVWSVIDHGAGGGVTGRAAVECATLRVHYTIATDGTVMLGSGYIVSRIQLFIHFWVSVYTSQQPV